MNKELPSEVDPCGELRAQLEEAEKKAAENLAGWQRAVADYQNLQKQVAEERRRLWQLATEQMILDLLPVLDAAGQAQAHAPNDQWATGVKHVFDGLRATLKAQGLEEMKTVGEKFDPVRHESVGARKEDGKESSVVLEEQRPGYLLGGKIIRPAQVIISE